MVRRYASSSDPGPADPLVTTLAAAGFVAAEAEAAELRRVADGEALDAMVARRLTGEPLAWIAGSTKFAGLRVLVHPGVYVPRPHSEVVARAALERLPDDGIAVDVCTGSGVIAAFLRRSRPKATVVATDTDPAAVACARSNGVDARCGDLLGPVGEELLGAVDVIVGVVPYVPTGSLRLLQRDTLAFETTGAYDGGDDGGELLRRVAEEGRLLLRAGGALVLELGSGQAAPFTRRLAECGYSAVVVLRDDDGDERGVAATWRGTPT